MMQHWMARGLIWSGIVIGAVTSTGNSADPAGKPRCALIPFVNGTKRPSAAYLADVIHPSLHYALGQTGAWTLLERAAVKTLLMESDLKASNIAAGKPARLEGADLLVLGEYRDDEGRVTVSARLVQSDTGTIVRQAVWVGHVSGLTEQMPGIIASMLADRLPPSPVFPPDQQARFEKACRLLHRGQIKRAIQECTRILDNHPRHVPTLLLRGEAQLQKKGWIRYAAKDFESVLDIDEESLTARIGLARVKLTEGRRGAIAAARQLDEVLEQQPEHGEALWLKAIALERTSETEAAMRSALQATRVLPTFAPAWRTLARLQLSANDVGNALGSSMKAVQFNPDDPGNWMLLGDVQLAAGQRIEAKESFRKALRCDPPPELKKRINARLLRFE